MTIDDTLSALADPTRRGIVELLRSKRRRPSEIAEALGVGRTMLSRHLRILREAGLIAEEVDAQDARSRFLHLEPAPLVGLQGWIDDVSGFWTDQLGAFVEHAERSAARARRPGAERRAADVSRRRTRRSGS